MVREIVISELKEILDIEDINDDMNLFDDLALSSLEIFEMFATFEEKLKITIKEEAISDIATVKDLIDVTEKIVNSQK